jgi:hypothetical protein
MSRHFSMDDSRVGRGTNRFFKVSGTKDHPQRIAYIPAEATRAQLVVSDELEKRASRSITNEIRQRAHRGDERCRRFIADVERAQVEKEDINSLRETISEKLNSRTKSAEFWNNESGVKVVLYPRTEMAETFWIDDIGQVLNKEGIPPECYGDRKPEPLYGVVIIEYELDGEGEVRMLPPERQIDVGGGGKLDFRYYMKPWFFTQKKVDDWKEQARKNPMIFCDYEVFTVEKNKGFPITKFVPSGPAIWRRNPGVMLRIIREARKFYAELPRQIGRDFTIEEIVKLTAGNAKSSGESYDDGPAASESVQEFDFAALLGQPEGSSANGASSATPALEHSASISGMDLESGAQGEHTLDAAALEEMMMGVHSDSTDPDGLPMHETDDLPLDGSDTNASLEDDYADLLGS